MNCVVCGEEYDAWDSPPGQDFGNMTGFCSPECFNYANKDQTTKEDDILNDLEKEKENAQINHAKDYMFNNLMKEHRLIKPWKKYDHRSYWMLVSCTILMKPPYMKFIFSLNPQEEQVFREITSMEELLECFHLIEDVYEAGNCPYCLYPRYAVNCERRPDGFVMCSKGHKWKRSKTRHDKKRN